MKFQSSIGKLLALVSVLFLSGGTLYAEESNQSTQTAMPKNNGAMGSMHMDEMMNNINECKNMHMDAKMCDHQTMETCQKNMGKGECRKMMKQAKAKLKAEKKN